MKKTYVLFKNNDATLFVNKRPSIIKKGEILLENPDLSRVQGTSPHYWKLVNNSLVFPMNVAERKIKHATHRAHYRTLKGVNYGKIALRVLMVLGCFVLGGLVTYYLMKQGRIK
jgi:hypothetical protein